ncbi:DUF1285 domain-containing protein [Cereibacter changlensis]|uniref:DUF1285 domain-containing protein n=1 Tax=Cereibacter changlensis TaxID=402884 RepID=A0A4U0YYS6_9RHOB|nr:DUF1285 domain-containing protein [Cereibacter changlensis]TKA97035.1 DUF1285 domain-containing protein [Cereibacter changlensis]
MIVKPSADGLLAAATEATRTIGRRGPALVHLWNPPFCGDLDIRIARDGTWFYLGTPIGRPAMVQLFSSILKLEEGKYFLVTPGEKVGITVDDAPFVAVDFTVAGAGPDQQVSFETQVGDLVACGPEHPLRVVRAEDGEPSPYVMVRNGLEALIDRKSFYRLVEICVHEPHEGARWFGLWSGGRFFPLIPSAELP